MFQVTVVATIVSGISGCASTNSSTYYDPLYFNSSDRTKVKYANTNSNSYKNTRSEATLSKNVATTDNSSEYYREAPSQYLPSHQANVGHSNIQQQGSTGGGDTYINNYYDSYQQNHNRRNNSWWQPNTMFFVSAAPAFYTPIMPMRRSMWWGRPALSVGIGWNSMGGWHSGMNWGVGMAYNPWYYSPAFGWYDPFYSHFGYYDPFWYGSYNWGWRNYAAWHSPYRNFYQVNNYYYGNNNSGGGNNSGGDLGGGRVLPAQPRGGRGGHAAGIDNNLPGGGRVGTNNSGGRVAEGGIQEPISGGRAGRGTTPDRYAPNTNTSSYGSNTSSTEYVRPTRGTRGIENNPQNSNTNTYTPSYETGRIGGGRVPQQNYQAPVQQQETMFQQQQRQSRSSNDFFNDRPSRNESFSSPSRSSGGGHFSTPSGGGGNSGGNGRGSRGGR